MAVTLIKESNDYESYWVVNSSADYDGTALYLFKNGTYKKCGWANAQTMTSEEAKYALNKLNQRLPRPARASRYMPEWN